MTRRTGVLVTIILATVLIHYFPRIAPAIWFAAVVAGGVWVIRTGIIYFRYHQRVKRRDEQRLADAAEYGNYEREIAALRAGSPTADAFDQQAAALQEKHRAMLTRRFGPH